MRSLRRNPRPLGRGGCQGMVITEGAGGFLNPPTHPEHTQSVRSSYGRTFSLSLTEAAKTEWLDAATRNKAADILKRWKPLPIGDASVQEWILQVLGYFHNCYKGGDGTEAWFASALRIDRYADPVLNANLHAGVHSIRQYYPDFTPTAEHFRLANWGKDADNAGR
jgi:hypothetical protein